MTDGGGSQFQPPQMPGQMPDYQGGNQPPLNQDNGISIYNTGAQGAPQQGGQQGAQQQPGNQQPQHGSQIPDYQTATPYTQGPGQANPDYQAPQQNSPQQGQQPQQQQPNQQQEQQPQNKQDQDTQQLNQRQQQCQQLANATSGQLAKALVSRAGGAGSLLSGPGQDPVVTDTNGCCPPQESPGEGKSWVERTKQIGRCAWAVADLGLTYAVPGGIGAGIVKLTEKAGPVIVKAVKEFVEQIGKIKAATAGSGGGVVAFAWALVKSGELAKAAIEVYKLAVDYFVGPPKAFVEECFLKWK
ncbi:hypothetical protein [Mycobacterium sp. NPDC050853]|uniref:hypothetical protein n=1 Tax=Mycobacterium sp. NPDC050853 TaxID=3155160 RepID=UPI00340C32CF